MRSLLIIWLLIAFPAAAGRGEPPPLYVESDAPSRAVLRHGDPSIELNTETVWRPMCGSGATDVTAFELRDIVDRQRAAMSAGASESIAAPGAVAGGFRIDVVVSGGFSPAAEAAFRDAVAHVESRFTDPITITISAGMSDFGNPRIIGLTAIHSVEAPSWTIARDAWIADMDGDDVIQSFLPTVAIPVRFDAGSAVVAKEDRCFFTKANFAAAIGSVDGVAAAIQFNGEVGYDFDPSNGVSGGSLDFQSLVVHELGHVLGFTSSANAQSEHIKALDVFRFSRSDGAGDWNPDTLSEFRTAARSVDLTGPGDDETDLIVAAYPMESGATYKSSHFRDNLGIGLMDPTLAPGETHYPGFFSPADLAVLDALGWDLIQCESQSDGDGDGVSDCDDACPNDPNKILPGRCGCGVAETDRDQDQTPDCVDQCPTDRAKTSPGQCGCGVSDVDQDGDGTADCNDRCPTDPQRVAPGACGCGVADHDRDGDGTPDCNDGCPDDPAKVQPGVCGCGIAETDRDGDNYADCVDNCPSLANPLQKDCDGDGLGDLCAIARGRDPDCNANQIPDGCELGMGRVEPCSVSATDGEPWCDDFEGYSVGSIQPYPGWESWGPSSLSLDTSVSTDVNHTVGGSKSLLVRRNRDALRPFEGYDASLSDRWIVRAWVYVPAGMSGKAWLILFAGDHTDSGYTSATWIGFDSHLGVVYSSQTGDDLPLVEDRWVEVRITVDFAADELSVYYDGELLTTHAWTLLGGSRRIAGLDVYGPTGTGFYADDLNVSPRSDVDCNHNGVLDECDLRDGTSYDDDADGLPDECGSGALNSSAKNRYISFTVGGEDVPTVGARQAIRVTLRDLNRFESFNGAVRWVGPPEDVYGLDDGATPLHAARLQCEPFFANWAELLGGVGEQLHVYGREVVPGSTYDVQSIDDVCDRRLELCYSRPLAVHTAKWGDVMPPFDDANGSEQPDFSDVAGLIGRFAGAPSPNDLRAQLQPAVIDPHDGMTFGDIAAAVDAFTGRPYPYFGPTSCP